MTNQSECIKLKASEYDQVDAMAKDDIFREPWHIPKIDTVLRQVWTYKENKYGNNKSINWCDGYLMKVKGFQYAK